MNDTSTTNDYGLWTAEERREVYVGSLVMNAISFWSSSFMVLNCLTVGKGRGVSAIVGAMMFTNCVWHGAQMVRYTMKASGRSYSDENCESNELLVKYLLLSVVLWICILAAFLCFILYEAVEDSFHYVESNGIRRTDSLIGKKSWIFISFVVFGLPLIPLILMKSSHAIQRIPGIDECAPSKYWTAFGWLLPAGIAIIFVFMSCVAAIILTFRLIKRDERVLPAFRIVGPWNPVIRLFLYVLGMIISLGPDIVLHSISYLNHTEIPPKGHLVLNLGMYSIGTWNCMVYSLTSKEIRKKYKHQWWLLIPTFFCSPIIIPLAFVQWARRVHYVSTKPQMSEPLLRYSRPQKEVFSAF